MATPLFLLQRCLLTLGHQLFNGTTQLVGARCGLAVAAYALEALNDILISHTFHQLAYPLQVAVATTKELHINHHTVLPGEFNKTRASALRAIGNTLHIHIFISTAKLQIKK